MCYNPCRVAYMLMQTLYIAVVSTYSGRGANCRLCRKKCLAYVNYLAAHLLRLRQHPHRLLQLRGCCRRWSARSATGAATGW